MKKNEKKQELLNVSHINFINDPAKSPLTLSCLGSFIDNTQCKITKISKQVLLEWGKIGKRPKGDKKMKK